jgi:hypothetical protein
VDLHGCRGQSHEGIKRLFYPLDVERTAYSRRGSRSVHSRILYTFIVFIIFDLFCSSLLIRRRCSDNDIILAILTIIIVVVISSEGGINAIRVINTRCYWPTSTILRLIVDLI